MDGGMDWVEAGRDGGDQLLEVWRGFRGGGGERGGEVDGSEIQVDVDIMGHLCIYCHIKKNIFCLK